MRKSAYMKPILIQELVDVLKALADQTRLRIIWLLLKAKSELCVCEIMDSLNKSQYNVSRHLKILKNAGLVQERKEGRWVFYSLVKPANQVQKQLLAAIRAISEKVLAEDKKRLEKRLSLRKDGKVVIGMKCILKGIK
uniref:ArsR family transcriptional regulator n=1 Tax=candidate division WOR-3 bacterium TaxID=2052148 RepID=A0A7C6A916_UNCW3